MKQCSQCKVNLRLDAFSTRNSQRDGTQVRPECKECRIKLNKAYWVERTFKRDLQYEAYRTPRGYRLEEV